MDNSGLVSIIIPAYNTEPHIHRAIESCLRQTYTNIEVLVIDDGSTDGTLKVAQSYTDKDGRISVFHQENGGVSSARNYGIREAKGEYMIFLDSDDWLEDDAVEILHDAQVKYPDKLVLADRYFVNLSEEDGKFHRMPRHRLGHSEVFDLKEAISAMSALELFSSCYILYSADILEKHDLSFNKKIHYGEDSIFVFQYLCMTKGLFYTKKLIWNVLIRMDSATHLPQEQRKTNSEECYDILDKFDIDDAEIRKLVHIRIARGRRYALSDAMNKGASKDKIISLRENCKKYMKEFLTSETTPLSLKLIFLLGSVPADTLGAYCLKNIFRRTRKENGQEVPAGRNH